MEKKNICSQRWITMKIRSKKIYYQNKLQISNNNIKTSCKSIKESIGKSKVFLKDFPKILRLNKISITDKKFILDVFIKFFINMALFAKLPLSNNKFYSHKLHISTIFPENSLTEEEFKNTFLS